MTPIFLLADGLVVGIVDAFKEFFAQQVVLDLFLGVEIDRVVVGREFVALEELNGSLI